MIGTLPEGCPPVSARHGNYRDSSTSSIVSYPSLCADSAWHRVPHKAVPHLAILGRERFGNRRAKAGKACASAWCFLLHSSWRLGNGDPFVPIIMRQSLYKLVHSYRRASIGRNMRLGIACSACRAQMTCPISRLQSSHSVAAGYTTRLLHYARSYKMHNTLHACVTPQQINLTVFLDRQLSRLCRTKCIEAQ